MDDLSPAEDGQELEQAGEKYEIVKSSYMRKCGTRVKSWKTRWFELCTDGYMRYYKNQEAFLPIGEIYLYDAYVREAEDKDKHSTRFNLETRRRLWKFEAETQEDLLDWTMALDDIAGTLESDEEQEEHEMPNIIKPMQERVDEGDEKSGLGDGGEGGEEGKGDDPAASPRAGENDDAGGDEFMPAELMPAVAEQEELPKEKFHEIFNLDPGVEQLVFETPAGFEKPGRKLGILPTRGQLYCSVNMLCFHSASSIGSNAVTKIVAFDQVTNVSRPGNSKGTLLVTSNTEALSLSGFKRFDDVHMIVTDLWKQKLGEKPPSLLTGTPSLGALVASPDMHGVLTKIMSGSITRTFYLKGPVLAYFRKKSEAKPNGIIYLVDCKAARAEHITDMEFTFGIFFAQDESHFLKCSSEAEMNAWIKAVNDNCPRCTPRVQETLNNLVQSGSLETLSNVKMLFERFGLPPGEVLVDSVSGALNKVVTYPGRVFFTRQHLCFSGNILMKNLDVVIALEDIQDIQKSTALGLLRNGIRVVCDNESYLFHGFISRDHYFKILIDLWKVSLGEPAPSLAEGRPTAAALEDPERAGWLWKASAAMVGGLSRRWFVLHNQKLYYYKTPADINAAGSCDMRNVMAKPADDLVGERASLALFSLQGRSYFMKAASETDRDDWVAIINSTVPKLSKNMRLALEELSDCGSMMEIAGTKEMFDLFEIPKNDILADTYPASPGRIYLTMQCLCYSAGVVSTSKRKMIRFIKVTEIEPCTNLFGVSNGIRVSYIAKRSENQKVSFVNITRRDDALKLAIDLWHMARGLAAPSLATDEPTAPALGTCDFAGYLRLHTSSSHNIMQTYASRNKEDGGKGGKTKKDAAQGKDAWMRAWVVLNGNRLVLYPSKASASPMLQIRLVNCQVEMATALFKNDTCLGIYSLTAALFFRARDSRRAGKWLALLRAVATVPDADQEDPLRRLVRIEDVSDITENTLVTNVFDLPPGEFVRFSRDAIYQRKGIAIPSSVTIYLTKNYMCIFSKSVRVKTYFQDIFTCQSYTVVVIPNGIEIETELGEAYILHGFVSRDDVLKVITDFWRQALGELPPSIEAKSPTAAILGEGDVSGYVEKMNTNTALLGGSTWQRRWGVIANMNFHYFKGRRDVTPAGVVSIENCLAISAKRFTGKDSSFGIFSSTGRTFILNAYTIEDARRWVANINSAVGELEPPVRERLLRLATEGTMEDLQNIQQLFDVFELPAGEELYESFKCGTAGQNGRMHLTTNFLCFAGNSVESKIVLKLADITDIDPGEIKNVAVVTVDDGSQFDFTSIKPDYFSLLMDVWKISNGHEPPSLETGTPTAAAVASATIKGEQSINLKGTAGGSFITAWCAVLGPCLYVYKAQQDLRPKAAISLKECAVMPATHITGQQNSFGIFSLENDPVFVRCSNAAEFTKWMDGVRESIPAMSEESREAMQKVVKAASGEIETDEQALRETFLSFQVGPVGTFLGGFPCSLQKGLNAKGYLLFTRKLCMFFGKVFLKEVRHVIPFQAITAAIGSDEIEGLAANAVQIAFSDAEAKSLLQAHQDALKGKLETYLKSGARTMLEREQDMDWDLDEAEGTIYAQTDTEYSDEEDETDDDEEDIASDEEAWSDDDDDDYSQEEEEEDDAEDASGGGDGEEAEYDEDLSDKERARKEAELSQQFTNVPQGATRLTFIGLRDAPGTMRILRDLCAVNLLDPQKPPSLKTRRPTCVGLGKGKYAGWMLKLSPTSGTWQSMWCVVNQNRSKLFWYSSKMGAVPFGYGDLYYYDIKQKIVPAAEAPTGERACVVLEGDEDDPVLTFGADDESDVNFFYAALTGKQVELTGGNLTLIQKARAAAFPNASPTATPVIQLQEFLVVSPDKKFGGWPRYKGKIRVVKNIVTGSILFRLETKKGLVAMVPNTEIRDVQLTDAHANALEVTTQEQTLIIGTKTKEELDKLLIFLADIMWRT